jgi:hypothetical protein
VFIAIRLSDSPEQSLRKISRFFFRFFCRKHGSKEAEENERLHLKQR